MQSTIGLKRHVVSCIGGVVLVIGAVVGLAATDNLPWLQDGYSTQASDRRQASNSPGTTTLSERARRFYEHKEARMEKEELQASVLAARGIYLEKMRRYFEHKEEMLDRLEGR
jgi:hypothetical protein